MAALLTASACSSDVQNPEPVTSATSGPVASISLHSPTISSSGAGGTLVQNSDGQGKAPDAPAGGDAAAPNPAVEAAYAAAFARLKAATSLEAGFAAAEALEEVGRPAGTKLLKDIAGLTGLHRIAAARALHSLGHPTAAIKVFADVAGNEELPREERLAAAELISLLAWEMHKDLVSAAIDKTFDVPVKIELSVALWNTARAQKAKTELNALLKTDSANFRQQAALGLGRLSVPDLTNCREILRALADEPTDRGLIAQQILLKERLGKELDLALQRTSPANPEGDLIKVDTQILDRVRTMVRQRYIYADQLGTRRLAIAAASGVLAHLDAYSMYLDGNLTRRASAIRQFEVPTLGISLGARKFRAGSNVMLPTIVSVAEGSPADRAGLAPGDQILNVAPTATLERVLEWRSGAPAEWNEALQDFLSLKLGGVVDAMLPRADVTPESAPQPLALLIRRDGWYLNRWVPLAHELSTLPEFTQQMLPGELGYARIRKLGADAPANFRDALKAFHTGKAKGILLDLRNSSGGSPQAAVDIAGMLLPDGAVIASTKGRDTKLIKPETFKATADILDTEIPVTVLVNGGTADAAEILAAALKEHGRAKLVGSATFGRAVIQEVINIEAEIPREDTTEEQAAPSREQHALLLTVGHWYTPVSNRRISEGGVAPDVTAAQDLFEGWVYDQLDELRGQGAIRNYVASLVTKHSETALKLAENDGGNTSAYPGWAEFAAKSTKNLTSEQLRYAVRRELRIRLMSERKLPGFADLESDNEFVAGIRTLAGQVGLDLSEVAEYRTISTK